MSKTRDNQIWTPKALKFREYYLNPNSETFWNIRGSALRAGFSESYANNMTGQARPPKWWLELREESEYRRAELLALSEKNMQRVLKLSDEDGHNKTVFDGKLKTSMFVSERLGKEHYSTRQELTGKDGRRLFSVSSASSGDSVSELFKGVQSIPATARKRDK